MDVWFLSSCFIVAEPEISISPALVMPVKSNAPHFMRLSTTFLLALLKSTRAAKSSNEENFPVALASIIASIAAAPTFLTAASPNLIVSPATVKSIELSFKSGGSIFMPESLHSPMYFMTLSVSPMFIVRSALMNSGA